jgi:hypothetical protein
MTNKPDARYHLQSQGIPALYALLAVIPVKTLKGVL